jgi:hypothetical protein
LLLFENGSCQDHALAPLFNASSQKKKRAQVLLGGAGADVELIGDFLITAALHEQLQYLLVAAGDFNLFEAQHA